MVYIGWTVTFIVGVTFSYILKGWALSILWGWFIVDIFNISPINIPEAIGLSLIIGYLTKEVPDDDGKNDKDMKEVICKGIAVGVTYPALAVLTGWVVTLFM
jgi:hypothetical protein